HSMENLTSEIKMIAIDIDGTLLTPAGQITTRTRAAIQVAQRAGIIVTLATARRYTTAGMIAAELGIKLPLIVYDGSLIASYPAATILHRQLLSAQVVCQAVEIFQQHAIQPVIHPCDCPNEEVWLGPIEHDHLELATYVSQANERLCRMSYAALGTLLVDPLRVVAFASEEAIRRMLPQIVALDCAWHLLTLGSYGCAELTLMNPGCSKASGVAALAAHYAIPLAQVMAIGDNTNDVVMLQSVGWGVAMGQAPEVVKAVANAVTASNSEDGVALAIERYALASEVRIGNISPD
ncbi:MAG: Cof-type HAD-IIB family hydrolase, partial [Ktedonobacteraceae bacterium]